MKCCGDDSSCLVYIPLTSVHTLMQACACTGQSVTEAAAYIGDFEQESDRQQTKNYGTSQTDSAGAVFSC